ncbi:bsl4622 [Bradyrhizobium diazoefficiens USDA 110]|jgi:hypothetical protein|uniref:Bsl4622 protein n=1 Tax=Bradyrhizobium diazoefficiens (strain JCM 10833 / BCRC 13528 / IAM 13628 / NBRC 14792 / USDA 110) TaxID=224911 RepID=Q89LC3_BRADU|nr:hypothetical protein CO678_36575 [Bradyrhizobium diazoefficiens]QBP23397.1 hypothetical protein Bdiaspc4_24185 [Bradyrhizobium diazoefficiens]BAC49887.1 bsl4622 [Bradyrhizobium diazoefficiens USDA 110]
MHLLPNLPDELALLLDVLADHLSKVLQPTRAPLGQEASWVVPFSLMFDPFGAPAQPHEVVLPCGPKGVSAVFARAARKPPGNDYMLICIKNGGSEYA